MQTNKLPVSAEWTDPDDAPILTKRTLGQAEFLDGDWFIARGRGRPRSAAPKKQINIRLDPDMLERLRANGPGSQTRINEILGASLGFSPST